MSECMLFRAPAAAGPVTAWREAHFEPLGSEDEVVAALRALFAAPLRWSRYDDSGWIFALGDNAGQTVDLMFRVGAGRHVDYLVARKASAATVAKLVTAFRLNFVFDPARAAYLDPAQPDADGGCGVAAGLHELAPR